MKQFLVKYLMGLLLILLAPFILILVILLIPYYLVDMIDTELETRQLLKERFKI